MELNFISDNIVRDMKKKKTLENRKNFLFEYIKEVSETEYNSINQFYENLSKEDKKAFIDEVMENGIQLHQPPFWDNLDLKGLAHLYNKYGYKPYDIFINGKKVEKPMILGDEYMLRLKHEPSSKLSVRSTSFINIKNNPSKSLSFKRGNSPYSQTPIRLGEMELIGLLIAKNSSLQAKFNSFYSNSEFNRQHLSEELLSTDNILDLKSVDYVNRENSSMELLNVLFKTLGIRLENIEE